MLMRIVNIMCISKIKGQCVSIFYVDVIVNDFEEIPKTSFPGKEEASSASLGGPTRGEEE